MFRRVRDASAPVTIAQDGSGAGTRARLSLVSIGLFYLGASTVLPTVLPIQLGLVSSQLLVALWLASIGWRRMTSLRWLPGHWILGVGYAVTTVLSSILVWQMDALYWSATNVLWFGVIIPGIAALLREESERRAFVCGLMLAASVVSVTAAVRLVTTGTIFDADVAHTAVLFGIKRGLLNAHLLLILPFVFWFWRNRLIRLSLVGLIVLTLVASGGRSALLGLGLIGVVSILLQPSIRRRVRVLTGVVAVAAFTIVAITALGGEAAVGLERLTTFLEDGGSSERRVYEVQRAWRVGLDHPVFGVGHERLGQYGFESLDSGVPKSLLNANEGGGAHNTYAEEFAEVGAPATALFLGLVLGLLLAAIRARERRETRAMIIGSSAMLMMMAFHPLTFAALYTYIPLLVGLVAALGSPAPKGPGSGVPSRGSV